MLKIAMLSKWHVHAEGYARDFIKTGKAEITAVWDEKPDRGKEWAENLGVEFVDDLDTLLARDDVDAVCCCTPTTMHSDVLIRCAKAGKHIFTEKTLACTVEECNEIAKAVEENGVTFVISFPHKAWPVVRFAKEHIENGDFGRVTNVRIRNAHNGVSGNWLPDYWFVKEDCAGGAMMDLGCHPMYLLAYLCGKPKKITGIANSVLGT
ncbi:MAG: Gfo/Idh/MocA family oxidoreductase, partial [Acutalibacteraceae bacterium]|nr:Gfo/Idh/MocA family oxidoreductase [Acutalibacteraceae bacterium]